MKVTIATTRRGGDIEVHAAGCRDLTRAFKYDDDSPWTIDAVDQREVIEEVYYDIAGDSDPPTPWTAFESEIKFYPCTGLERVVLCKCSSLDTADRPCWHCHATMLRRSKCSVCDAIVVVDTRRSGQLVTLDGGNVLCGTTGRHHERDAS